MKPLSDFDSWTLTNVGALIAAIPYISSMISGQTIKTAISDCIDKHYSGSASAYAKAFGIPRANVKRWRAEETLPSLEHLIRICYLSGTSLIDFITTGVLNHQRISSANNDVTCLFQKHLRHPNAFNHAKIQKSLEMILRSKSANPPSMTRVAQKLVHTNKTLYRHFPVLCRHIAAKAARYRKNLKEQRIGQERLFVEAAAEQLCIEGIYPSYNAVESKCSKKGILRGQEARYAWRSKLSKMGLRDNV